jgi:hypothetical protein
MLLTSTLCGPDDVNGCLTDVRAWRWSHPPLTLLDVASTRCAWCATYANMRPVGPWKTQDLGYPGFGGPDTRVTATFECDHCGRFLLGSATTTRETFRSVAAGDWLKERAHDIDWIPTNGSQPPEFPAVPPHIGQAAQEAYVCFSINAHRAAISLSRSVVEATCKDKEIFTGSLKAKIDELYEKKWISELTRDAAHAVREFGNDMAHGDFVEPVTREEAELVLTLMRELLDETYEKRARVIAAQQKRAAREAAARTRQAPEGTPA